MTREEIVKRMKEIEEHRFELAMIDVWSERIRRVDSELFIEWESLMKALKEKD